MNLSKLFEMQKALDDHIIEEKHLEGQDLLPNKILALQVELGELANEWRGFKHWSNDREPRNKVKCMVCKGKKEIFSQIEFDMITCLHCDGTGKENESNPLLEEYVDCLHFILSIGLDERINVRRQTRPVIKTTSLLDAFNDLFINVADLSTGEDVWDYVISQFVLLGQLLGFTWDEIEQAYFAKNDVNHQRQVDGY